MSVFSKFLKYFPKSIEIFLNIFLFSFFYNFSDMPKIWESQSILVQSFGKFWKKFFPLDVADLHDLFSFFS